jgi:hypothetical protein
MARRSVDKASTGVVSNMIAGEERNLKIVIATKALQRMDTN